MKVTSLPFQSHTHTHKHTHLHECQTEVVGSAAPVHRVLYDVEGEDCHLLIHQDSKVITWKTTHTHAHTHSRLMQMR